MVRSTLITIAALCCATAASAAEKFFVYNETSVTDFTGVYLAPTGTQKWTKNEALNDSDKSLQRTERLLLTGIGHGVYDVRLVDQHDHVCVLTGIDLTHEKTFEIKDGDLSACK